MAKSEPPRLRTPRHAYRVSRRANWSPQPPARQRDTNAILKKSSPSLFSESRIRVVLSLPPNLMRCATERQFKLFSYAFVVATSMPHNINGFHQVQSPSSLSDASLAESLLTPRIIERFTRTRTFCLSSIRTVMTSLFGFACTTTP